MNEKKKTVCKITLIEPEEYLKDILLYQGQSFSYNETEDVINCMRAIMQEAEEKRCMFLCK